MKLENRTKTGGFRPWTLQKMAFGDMAHRFIQFKLAVGPIVPGMHHFFGNTLPVEMRLFFIKLEVLEQGRSTLAGSERPPVIRYVCTAVGYFFPGPVFSLRY